MMKWPMFRASLVGIGVLVAAHILYVGVLMRVQHHEVLRLVLLGFPFVAAFLVAWLAPRRKMIAGTSMAVWGAVFGLISSFIYRQLGYHIDEIGTLAGTFMIVLLYQGVLCVMGSGAAVLLLRKVRAASST